MKTETPLTKLRSFLSGYCHFAAPEIVLPLSIWIAATHIFEAFDCFPYLAITAHTKRAGDERRIALNIHMASMWIQQAYFYGCIDGGNRVSKNWNESIKNLGKAVQS